MVKLNIKNSNINYNNFLWHATFLALASSLMDIDTIIPYTLSELGGKTIQIGILISIMLGASSFSQIFFAPFIHNKKLKKPYLLIGINTRIISLIGLALLFFYSNKIKNQLSIWLFILLISIFSFSGAFANISYTDLLGKTILQTSRKKLLSMKQILVAIGLFISAIITKKILSYLSVPFNFSLLFIIASLFLGISSIGFWRIIEIKTKINYIKGTKKIIRLILSHIKNNKKLQNYLLAINTIGISLTLMPFLILYGSEFLSLPKTIIGTLLILKVSAGVLTGLFLFKYSKLFNYSKLLYSIVFLSILIILLAIFSRYYKPLFQSVFFVGGIMFAIYSITITGILLEISDNKNRALFTGLAGTGNIIPAMFPLLGSWIIEKFSFDTFFGIFIIMILWSIIFIYKLNCKK